MWLGLYESGAFDSMHFRSLDDVSVEDLSESEKEFCVRMAKEMVLIPKGDFMMGALEDDEEANGDEKPRHKVTLTQNFLIGKYQVTQVLWESVMGSNPSFLKGANRPVEQVRWVDVVEFCNELSELEGLTPAYTTDGQNVTCNWTVNGYRLPTEAEWECAARSGQQFKYAGSDNVDEVAWYYDNSGDETHPVGQKKPNGFGLYDMSGNVWEWLWDRMQVDDDWNPIGESVYPSGYRTDPTGPDSGPSRVFRGGSWSDDAGDTRVSLRGNDDPPRRDFVLGFRLSRLVQ